MPLPPSQMICFALYSATHAMQQAYRPLLAELGVTYPQYIVLSVLWQSDGPLTVGGIGRQVHLDSSTLTPLLKRLEAAGLITRARDSEDERQVRVSLTAPGRALEGKAAHIPACIFDATGLSAADLARLHREVAALADRLRDAPSPA
ncbi:MAG: MarR family transcriptional regulator [Pseudomonadota bacterium]